MKKKICYFVIVFTMVQCRTKEEYVSLFPGKPEVPASIKQQHTYLLNLIKLHSQSRDSAGILAGKLVETMDHHFKEEEDFVFPLLGVLPLLAKGEMPDQVEKLTEMANRFRSNSGHMIAEHQMIAAQLDELLHISTDPDWAKFRTELHSHAQLEEEIYFPAAILTGEYLLLKSK